MGCPVFLSLAYSGIDKHVKVVKVGEDHMSANIEEKAFGGDVGAREAAGGGGGVDQQPVIVAVLGQTGRGAQAGGPGTDNEDFYKLIVSDRAGRSGGGGGRHFIIAVSFEYNGWSKQCNVE